MRNLMVVSLLVVVILTFGCSKTNLTSPQETQQVTDNESEFVVLAAGQLNLETGTNEPLRDLSAYMNVTSLLGSNFSYSITGWYPPDILEIELNINNVSPYTVHDVCIVLENTYGKEVPYPDGYMDIFQPYDLDPFFGFRMNDENRAFPPGSDSRNVEIRYPSGANPRVDYFIIAHLGGNTGGVYVFSISGVPDSHLYESGGSQLLSAFVADHQGDIGFVAADTRQITGDYIFFEPTGDPSIWQKQITNSQGASAGEYTCLAMAKSPATPSYNTYCKIKIQVLKDPGTLFVDDDNVSGPWDGSELHPFRYIQDAVDAAADDWTINVKPGIYYEDFGGPSSSPNSEIYIYNIKNLSIIGEDMPHIFLHEYDDSASHAAIYADSCEGLVIDGFEFEPAPTYDYVVILKSCPDAVLKNCKVTPSPSLGFRGILYAFNCSNLNVVDNNFTNMVLTSSLKSWSFDVIKIDYCNYARISNNVVKGLNQSSIPTGSGINYEYRLFSFNGSNNLEFSKNIIGGLNWGYSWNDILGVSLVHFIFCDNLILRNNLFYKVQINDLSSSITGVEVIDFSASNNIVINHNTITNIQLNKISGMAENSGIWFDGNSVNPALHSNIISDILAPNAGWAYGIGASSAIEQRFSDVWNISDTRYYWEAIEGLGCLNSDPRFVDAINGDYHLAPGSPCIGNGIDDTDMGCYGGTDPLP